MTKRLIPMGDIGQFRAIVTHIKHNVQYRGRDADNKPILDLNAKAPIIHATGTEKIHGTNAAVCYSIPDGFWVQSHKNIITPEHDNAGCAFAATQNKEAWMSIIQTLSKTYSIDLDTNIVSVFFEWCGGNIQKNACVTDLPKMSMIFRHFKVSPCERHQDHEGRECAKWYETRDENGHWVEIHDMNIYNVCQFPMVEITIDFNTPNEAYAQMMGYTKIVEKESGIANYFQHPENVGEGWVWTCLDSNGVVQRWKTKGEEHVKTVPKAKKVVPVDTVKGKAKTEFVNKYACQTFRLEQMWNEVVENDENVVDKKKLGLFLKAVMIDVLKEESDMLHEMGLEPGDVKGMICMVAKDWFTTRLNMGFNKNNLEEF